MKKTSTRPRVVSRGKKPPKKGFTLPPKTTFQKLLERWPKSSWSKKES